MSRHQGKHAIRNRIWALLEKEQVVPPGVHGHIPDFLGADTAAERLATLPVWQSAQVIKAVPDRAQLPVRARALTEGKLVYMAVPKLADKEPFYVLDPATLTVPPAQAASHAVASAVARKASVAELQPVDLVICNLRQRGCQPARSTPWQGRWLLGHRDRTSPRGRPHRVRHDHHDYRPPVAGDRRRRSRNRARLPCRPHRHTGRDHHMWRTTQTARPVLEPADQGTTRGHPDPARSARSRCQGRIERRPVGVERARDYHPSPPVCRPAP